MSACSARHPNAGRLVHTTGRCTLPKKHSGDHCLNTGDRWENARCTSRALVKNRPMSVADDDTDYGANHTAVRCDEPAGHAGDHCAVRKDMEARNGKGRWTWMWDDATSVPGWLPRARIRSEGEPSIFSRFWNRLRGRG